jgi:hypothetical protein
MRRFQKGGFIAARFICGKFGLAASGTRLHPFSDPYAIFLSTIYYEPLTLYPHPLLRKKVRIL